MERGKTMRVGDKRLYVVPRQTLASEPIEGVESLNLLKGIYVIEFAEGPVSSPFPLSAHMQITEEGQFAHNPIWRGGLGSLGPLCGSWRDIIDLYKTPDNDQYPRSSHWE
jgi:hypothetical protein